MANETILLWAKAKKLGIEGYRKMSTSDLKTAIKRAEGSSGSTGRKTAAKSSPNGQAGRKTAPRKSAGRKTAVKSTASVKSAPAKSTARKSTPAKATAAKGTAKRPATGARKTTTTRKVTKQPVKRQARAQAQPSGTPGRNPIVDSAINWTLESPVGNDPKSNRGIIMKAVRRFKGNTEKVFNSLADKAQSMYPKTTHGRKRSKADAQTLLRWHIGRIKLDYVKSTDQHATADNLNYRKAANARFGRKIRANSKPASAKSAGSARKPAGRKTAAKSTRKPAGRQKAAQSRTRASSKSTPQRKTAAKRTTAKAPAKRTGAAARKRK
jgi:hypothetical protein